MIPFKETKQWLFLFSFLIISFIVGIIYDNWKSDEIWGEYIEVTDEIPLNSVITEKIMERGIANVKLTDGNYYWFVWAVNYNYRPNEFSDFIQIGDSLSKLNYSDKIEVWRSGIKYDFQILTKIEKADK